NWRGQVCVGEQQNVAFGVQHAVTHTVAFAAVTRILQQSSLGISAGKAARDFGGVVTGAVIHDDHFSLHLPFTDVGEYFGERSSQPFAFVVSRNDEAVIHL